MTDDGKTDGRELGYGNVDARVDESPASDSAGATGSGESGGGAHPADVETTHGAGQRGGQTDPACRSGANPNSVRQDHD